MQTLLSGTTNRPLATIPAWCKRHPYSTSIKAEVMLSSVYTLDIDFFFLLVNRTTFFMEVLFINAF